MKHLFAFITLLIVSVSAVSAQYMPQTKGAVLIYDAVDYSDSKAGPKTEIVTVTVADVATDDKGVVTVTVSEANSMTNEAETSQYVYTPSDQMTLNIVMTPEDFKNIILRTVRMMYEEAGQYLSEMDLNELAGMLKPTGKIQIPLPDAVEEGASFPNSSVRVNVMGQNMGMKIIKGKYLGYEDLDTPAGKYNCLKLEYKLSDNGGGNDGNVTAWYAKGTGLVKQTVCDKKGKPLAEQIIKEVK